MSVSIGASPFSKERPLPLSPPPLPPPPPSSRVNFASLISPSALPPSHLFSAFSGGLFRHLEVREALRQDDALQSRKVRRAAQQLAAGPPPEILNSGLGSPALSF